MKKLILSGFIIGAFVIYALSQRMGSSSRANSTTLNLAPATSQDVKLNQKPIGYLDGVKADGTVFGWSQDPDSLNLPLSVNLYFDLNVGMAGASPIAVTAGDARIDVNNQAFNYLIPANSALRDGKAHTVWAWGVDSADPLTNNTQLAGSPKSFTLAATSAGSTPTPTPNSQSAAYKDGTYTGKNADAFYGNLQVQIKIQSGKIVDVVFLDYPNDRPTSREINTQAIPYLKQEAIVAQSANVDIVSGATQSSEAFQQSLASALSQAKS